MAKSQAQAVKSRPGTTAWAFLVVSSDGQAESLEYQKESIAVLARERGWRITRNVEGVASGKAGPRRLMRELLVELRALEPEARPGYILMTRLDRVGRGSIVESQVVLRELIVDLGVSVWTRLEGEVKIDTAMAELMAAMKFALSRQENEVRRDKAIATFRRKIKAGLVAANKRPYGLAIGPEGKDVAVEPHAEAVRTAFKMRTAGDGYYAIGRALQAFAPPWVYKNGRELEVHWTDNRVSRLLRNRAYVGPVIDEVTFLIASRVRESATTNRSRDRRRVHPWPLSGAIRCYCGRSMCGLSSGPIHRPRTRYYACRAFWNHEGSVRLVRSEMLEDQFLKLLGALRASPGLIHRAKQRSPRSTALLDRRLRDAKAVVTALDKARQAAWNLNAAGKIRDADLQERLDSLAARRDEAVSTVANLRDQLVLAQGSASADRDFEALLASAGRLYKKSDEPNQRRISKAVSLAVGGLCVDEKADLVVRGAPAPKATRERVFD